MNLESVYNTLALIEKKYNQTITVEELERVSFYSYRNIQRIFKYACGITIGGYQQQLKVENAYTLKKIIMYKVIVPIFLFSLATASCQKENAMQNALNTEGPLQEVTNALATSATYTMAPSVF